MSEEINFSVNGIDYSKNATIDGKYSVLIYINSQRNMKGNNMAEDKRKTPRYYMEMAIEVMKKSIQERNQDDPSPFVGAVLVFPDGEVNTAYMGGFTGFR